ncbi:MAG: hypothetical protein GY862_33085 [Gammaproteobacteria bacterium]|nr:hypothetical protein [Gammaproteobacteria bacterium]
MTYILAAIGGITPGRLMHPTRYLPYGALRNANLCFNAPYPSWIESKNGALRHANLCFNAPYPAASV